MNVYAKRCIIWSLIGCATFVCIYGVTCYFIPSMTPSARMQDDPIERQLIKLCHLHSQENEKNKEDIVKKEVENLSLHECEEEITFVEQLNTIPEPIMKKEDLGGPKIDLPNPEGGPGDVVSLLKENEKGEVVNDEKYTQAISTADAALALPPSPPFVPAVPSNDGILAAGVASTSPSQPKIRTRLGRTSTQAIGKHVTKSKKPDHKKKTSAITKKQQSRLSDSGLHEIGLLENSDHTAELIKGSRDLQKYITKPVLEQVEEELVKKYPVDPHLPLINMNSGIQESNSESIRAFEEDNKIYPNNVHSKNNGGLSILDIANPRNPFKTKDLSKEQEQAQVSSMTPTVKTDTDVDNFVPKAINISTSANLEGTKTGITRDFRGKHVNIPYEDGTGKKEEPDEVDMKITIPRSRANSVVQATDDKPPPDKIIMSYFEDDNPTAILSCKTQSPPPDTFHEEQKVVDKVSNLVTFFIQESTQASVLSGKTASPPIVIPSLEINAPEGTPERLTRKVL